MKQVNEMTCVELVRATLVDSSDERLEAVEAELVKRFGQVSEESWIAGVEETDWSELLESTEYVTRSDLPDFDDFVTWCDQPDFDDFVKEDDLNELRGPWERVDFDELTEQAKFLSELRAARGWRGALRRLRWLALGG